MRFRITSVEENLNASNLIDKITRIRIIDSKYVLPTMRVAAMLGAPLV